MPRQRLASPPLRRTSSQQLATYIGWLLHGTRGALAVGILFILPGFLSILLLRIGGLVFPSHLFGRLGELHLAGLRLLVPAWETLSPAPLILGVAAFLALFRFRVGLIPTLAGSAAAGFLYRLIQG